MVNYNPPSREFLPLEDLMWAANHSTPVYIMADLNAHHSVFDYYTNRRGKDLYNTWLQYGSLKVIGPETGTFITVRGRKSKPDVVLTNKACKHHHVVETLPKNISDHAPIRLIISSRPIKIPCREYEKTKSADWNTYQSYIKNNISRDNLNNKPTEELIFVNPDR